MSAEVHVLRVRTPNGIDVTIHSSRESASLHYREECELWADEAGTPARLRHTIKRAAVLDRTRSEVMQ